MTLNFRLNPTLLACLILLKGLPALAQDNSAGALKLGETSVRPSIRLDYVSTDNTFRSPNDTIDSSQFIIQPSVNWTATRRLLDLSADYTGRFAAASDDSPGFVDHSLVFAGNAAFNRRHNTTARLALEQRHDNPGEGVLSTATFDDGFNVARFQNFDARIRHRFGVRDARGNLTGGLRARALNFSSRPEFTDGRDFTELDAFAEFGYRVSGDTRALIGTRVSNFEFQNDIGDRTEIAPYFGLAFNATGRLTGEVRVNIAQLLFSNDLLEDETDIFIEGDIEYQPSGVSTFNLILSRSIDNTDGSLAAGQESAISNEVSVSWQLDVSSRISTLLSIGFEQLDNNCPSVDYQTVSPAAELEYSLRRWISIGLEASGESRTVSSCPNVDSGRIDDFDKLDIGLFVRATL